MGLPRGHHGPVAGSGTVEDLWVAAAPMLATGPPEPVAAPSGPGWSFEVKWDGVRALALVRADGSLALRSRNGVDLSGRYPSIVARSVGEALAPLAAPAILDGECVLFDPDGRPSFTGALRGGAAVRFVVFDVLAWQGRDVRGEPLSQQAFAAGLTRSPSTHRRGVAVVRRVRRRRRPCWPRPGSRASRG